MNIARYGHVAGESLVLSLEGDTKVELAAPFGRDIADAGKGNIWVISVHFVGVIDTKIVHHESEADVACIVVPKLRCVTGREV